MNYKFEYKSQDERQNILNQNTDKFLIEEQNIAEGNFLIFSDVQPSLPKVQIIVKEDNLNSIQTQIANMQEAINLALGL